MVADFMECPLNIMEIGNSKVFFFFESDFSSIYTTRTNAKMSCSDDDCCWKPCEENFIQYKNTQ